MADVSLKDRAGDDYSYEDVSRVILLKPKNDPSDPDEYIIYTLESTAYNYEYEIV